MVRKQIYITDAQNRWLKERSDELRLPEAELIRRTLTAALGQIGSPATGGLRGDAEALAALLAFAESRVGLDISQARWNFRREEIYEDRLQHRGIPKSP